MTKSFYYDGNKLLTYNCLFNFVVGNRGGGKTFWSKEFAIKDFIKNGKEFIYLRRFETEFDKGKKEKFFDDIAHLFPEHEFKIKGYVAYIDNKPCGYFKTLSTAKVEKSVAFPKVNKIIFDEFILDKGYHHYLPDEVTSFLEMYETVCRMRLDVGLADDVRVFFLSNALTVTNPYFLYFKIKFNPNKTISRINENLIVELVQNEDFIKAKKQTRFGKLIEGTKYAEYNIENKFLRDDDTFVGKKSGTARYHFTLIYKGKKYGVWIDYTEGKYFVSEHIDNSCRLIFTITLEDHSPNTMLVKGKNSRMLKNFTEHYQMGNVIFESINIKNICYEIIRLFLV